MFKYYAQYRFNVSQRSMSVYRERVLISYNVFSSPIKSDPYTKENKNTNEISREYHVCTVQNHVYVIHGNSDESTQSISEDFRLRHYKEISNGITLDCLRYMRAFSLKNHENGIEIIMNRTVFQNSDSEKIISLLQCLDSIKDMLWDCIEDIYEKIYAQGRDELSYQKKVQDTLLRASSVEYTAPKSESISSEESPSITLIHVVTGDRAVNPKINSKFFLPEYINTLDDKVESLHFPRELCDNDNMPEIDESVMPESMNNVPESYMNVDITRDVMQLYWSLFTVMKSSCVEIN